MPRLLKTAGKGDRITHPPGMTGEVLKGVLVAEVPTATGLSLGFALIGGFGAEAPRPVPLVKIADDTLRLG